ncbi:MAG: hypothetical protein HQ546_03805, partial [Planctomycetes bacterium]|nr:hypothetical protein [Planctomycetota bacterium]
MNRILVGIICVIALAVAFAAAAEQPSNWWPERAAFAPTKGEFRDKLSPLKTYIYEGTDAQTVPLGDSNPAAPAKALDFDKTTSFALSPWPASTVWALGEIQPGRYWVGIQIHSGSKQQPDFEQGNWITVRVNGLCVDFLSLTPPVLLSNGQYAAEIQSAQTLGLKEGDRISIKGSGVKFIGKLILYKDQPSLGPVFRTPSYLASGRTELWFTQLSAYPKSDAKTGVVSFLVRNLANGPQTLDVDIDVTDYYGKNVIKKSQKLNLGDLAAQTGSLEFPIGDALRYRAVATIRDQSGLVKTKFAAFRADVTTGLRQTLSLNGRWEQSPMLKQYLVESPPGPSAEWMPYNVPGQMNFGPNKNVSPQFQDMHVSWARRSFEVPQRMIGQRLVLTFD